MPVDTTKASSSSRRPQRKITEEELKDIEVKRLRGELSCAECRRLKLRCDKKVPCGSCSRRGCESICPCGILSAGQGTRFILADTEQLHRKIAEMSHRIRQLEDSLAILQATVSGERHPLLSDELLKIKFGAETLSKAEIKQELNDEDRTKQSIDALGTLTLDDTGETKYFGRSAGSETLLMAGEDWDAPSPEDDEDIQTPLAPELDRLSNLFPFTTKHRTNTALLELLESHLPPYDRAWALAESYLAHGAYFFRPAKRDEVFEVLPNVYNSASARQVHASAADSPGSNDEGHDAGREDSPMEPGAPHALAMTFMLFALGALLDIANPPYNQEAERYYSLGRAALSLRSVFDGPQVTTVQAVGLMATYHSLAGKKYSRDSAWSLMSLAAKLAQSIGLHRDSARWNLDAKIVQRRRSLFWDIFAADVSHSLALGRPPAIHLSYVDCEFPLDEEATLNDAQEVQHGFWRMKHTFARDIFYAVVETTLTAKSPSYSTVLDLDRKVRELSFPAAFKPYARREDGEEEYFSSSLSLRAYYASQHRTVTMLYLHRSFFAQAMIDHPTNPLLSPFAPSYLTAYRCASINIKATAHQFDRCPEIAIRLWFLLYHTFSSAVIVGSVVTHSPNSSMASSALLDLGLAVELFEKASTKSRRAGIALTVLRKLKDKALRAFNQFCSATLPTQMGSGHASASPAHAFSSPSPFVVQSAAEDEDELAIFGGQMRVLTRRHRPVHGSHKGSPHASATDSPSPPGNHSAPSPPVSTHELQAKTGAGAGASGHPHALIPPSTSVHPSLMEYLSQSNMFGIEAVQFPGATASSQLSTPASASTSLTSSPPPARASEGEVYSSFMSYFAARGMPSGPPAEVSPVPSSTLSSPQTPAPPDWVMGAVAPQGSYKTDMTLWAQNAAQRVSPAIPAQGAPASLARLQQNGTPTTTLTTLTGATNTTTTLAPFPAALSPISEAPLMFPPAGYGYDASLYAGLFPGSGQNGTGMGGALSMPVEMGLTTESGMDAGWLTFMRDCGILETGQQAGS